MCTSNYIYNNTIAFSGFAQEYLTNFELGGVVNTNLEWQQFMAFANTSNNFLVNNLGYDNNYYTSTYDDGFSVDIARWANNFTNTDPLWSDTNNTGGEFVLSPPDVHLTAGSPAINAGTWLAYVSSSSGSGTSFTVDNAGYFFSGLTAANRTILGDLIQLQGQTARAVITSISGDTITVNTSLSWTNGQGVALAYNGIAPDVGAFEFQAYFVAIAHGDNSAAYSSDGISWVTSPEGLPSSSSWNSVAYGNGVFVAVADDTNAAYSVDGINWTPSPGGAPSDGVSVTYGNGVFVAISGGTNTVYSTNGIDWTASSGGLPSVSGFYGAWQSVAYGDGKFVAIPFLDDGDKAAYSSNGISWTTSSLPEELWSVIAYGNGTFVVTGLSTSDAYYSTNGVDWSLTSMPFSDKWGSAAYGNGTFVDVVQNGANAAYSTNGINWTASSGGMPSSDLWMSVAFGNGTFVAVASDADNSAAYSTNGIDWTAATLPLSDNWISVAAKQ